MEGVRPGGDPPWRASLERLRDAPGDRNLVRRVLGLAREHLGMDVAWVSELTESAQVIRTLSGNGDRFELREGSALDRAGSYCTRVVAGILPSVIPDTHADRRTRDLDVTHSLGLGLGAYVGVPLTAPGGRVSGMLCCISAGPRPGLDERDAGFLAALAQVVSHELAHEVEASARQEALHGRSARILRDESLWSVFQPIVDVRRGALVGVEALTRFDGPPHRPDALFAEAAGAGLGLEMELLAIRTALRHLGDVPAGAYLSVNASPDTLTAPELHALLAQLPAERIVVEVTEHVPVSDYDRLTAAIASLRALGVRLAVDDAGAGFASLSHIIKLHPDFIKLDISLTRALHVDPVRQALATSLLGFARAIGASMIAEGVEATGELDVLARLGVQFAQGYLFARPAVLPLPTTFPSASLSTLPRAGHLVERLAVAAMEATDLESLVRPILDDVLSLTGLETSYLTVYDAEEHALEHRYVRNAGHIQLPEGLLVPWAETLCARCQASDLRWTPDVRRDLPGCAIAEQVGVQTYLSVPVTAPDGSLLGTLCAGSTEPRYVSESTLAQVALCARLIADRMVREAAQAPAFSGVTRLTM